MDHFTPVPALLGGLLIGIASVVYLLATGRYAGVSGIFRSVVFPGDPDRPLDSLFIVGLVGGAALWFALDPAARSAGSNPLPLVIAGGLFVGFGTALGAGCTSGHGVCGLGRLSLRSLVAVVAFLATGMLTVYLVRHAFALA